MKHGLPLYIATALLIAATGFVACSDDDDDGPTGPDASAPTVTSVSANDSQHITLRFNEPVERVSAEDEGNYTITGGGGPIDVVNASLKTDQRTVVLTTTVMTTGSLLLTVDDVADMQGNAIDEAVEKPFSGSTALDTTPPEVVLQAPVDDATNVSRTEPIEIQFSEPVPAASFSAGFALVDNGNPVSVTVETLDDVHFSVQPVAPLAGNRVYAIELIGVADANANVMNDMQWTFRTEGASDNVRPTLVTTTPIHNSTGVSTLTNISMTFSEAIHTASFAPVIDPSIGVLTPVWSNGDATVTFEPVGALAASTQYTVTLSPGAVSDLAGNTNNTPITLTFTTGVSLQTGR